MEKMQQENKNIKDLKEEKFQDRLDRENAKKNEDTRKMLDETQYQIYKSKH